MNGSEGAQEHLHEMSSVLATETRRHGEGRQRLGLLVGLLVAGPVIAGVIYAVLAALGVTGPGASGLTLRHIENVLSDRVTWIALLWSVWIAFASTALATILAIAVATLFRGARGGDRFARLVAVVPLPVPHVVAALCGVLILSQSGLLARLAFAAGLHASPADMPELTNDRYGIGLIMALTWKEFSFLALVAFSVIAGRGAQLEETARSLGAGALQTFRVATLPLLWRGLLPSIIAVFTFVAGNYETAALLAPSSPLALPLLTMERYSDSSLDVRGEAFVLVLLATALAFCGVALHQLASDREKHR